MIRRILLPALSISAVLISIYIFATSDLFKNNHQAAREAVVRQRLEDFDIPWRDNADPDFSPTRMMKPFKPIEEFEIRQVGEAVGEIDDDELVLAVTIQGESRAYPINMLNWPRREIINDELAEQPIAATW